MRELVELTCDGCGAVVHHLVAAAVPAGWREDEDGRVTCPAHGDQAQEVAR